MSMTPKQTANVIADAILASLRIAHERGVLTDPEQHRAIAHAAANNAAQALLIVADDDRDLPTG